MICLGSATRGLITIIANIATTAVVIMHVTCTEVTSIATTVTIIIVNCC